MGKATATGFEPARAEPIGFQVQLLNLSDTLSVEPTRMRCRGVSPCKSDFSDACGLRATYTSLAVKRGYGATVARLTPDQTVGRSNRSGLNFLACQCPAPQTRTWRLGLGVTQPVPLAQWLERWSYEPKVAGSSPAWNILQSLLQK